MGESSNSFSDKSVNETGPSWEGLLPGRCSLGEQCIPSLHPTTAKVKRTEEINSVVMVRAAMKADQ